MRVLTARAEVRGALARLRDAVRAALPREERVVWSFPGHGNARTGIPTWSRDGEEALAVAVGDEGHWDGRTPVLIALSAAHPRICPVVEVNIPDTRGTPDRRINGTFARGPEGKLWLLHRGTRLTSHGGVITKAEIHAHFASRLIDVEDDGQVTPMIPIACLDVDRLVADLRDFAEAVHALKA